MLVDAADLPDASMKNVDASVQIQKFIHASANPLSKRTSMSTMKLNAAINNGTIKMAAARYVLLKQERVRQCLIAENVIKYREEGRADGEVVPKRDNFPASTSGVFVSVDVKLLHDERLNVADLLLCQDGGVKLDG